MCQSGIRTAKPLPSKPRTAPCRERLCPHPTMPSRTCRPQLPLPHRPHGNEARRSAMPAPSTALPIPDIAAVRCRPVVAVLEERFGRPIHGGLLSADLISRVKPPGLGKLQTNGPLTHRRVVLEDSLPPHLPVAVAWSLTVEARLPVSVRVGLAGTGEPLDRLLTSHHTPWTAEFTEDAVASAASAASAHFAWAAPDTPLSSSRASSTSPTSR